MIAPGDWRKRLDAFIDSTIEDLPQVLIFLADDDLCTGSRAWPTGDSGLRHSRNADRYRV